MVAANNLNAVKVSKYDGMMVAAEFSFYCKILKNICVLVPFLKRQRGAEKPLAKQPVGQRL
jgi:hypothetical protein